MRRDSEDAALEAFLNQFRQRNPKEPKLNQAVEEFARSIMPAYVDNRDYQEARVLERLTEPDRIIRFRVSWKDDAGDIRINRAWRVQHNNCLGPYKGGLRFHKDVTADTLKFLAFEQTLKNSLTGLPMGGAKGGTNFDPKGKSADEIMHFCQSLMVELYRYIGEHVDIPAGDIGVGDTEIGYLFGHYMRLKNSWTGVLTGKGCSFGGSAGRIEATGYGCVHFARSMLQKAGQELEGQRIAISGSGTVALYAAEKALDEGAIVVNMSDSGGSIRFTDGMTRAQLDDLLRIKQRAGGTVQEFAARADAVEYRDGGKPWLDECDVAMPCATENELDGDDAAALIENGVVAVCEGANMPCTADAIRRFRQAGVLFAPGKAANAGGVAVSGMELTQNVMRISWPRERVDEELRKTMHDIHELCVEHGQHEDRVDYIRGANLASFYKVADALVAYGMT